MISEFALLGEFANRFISCEETQEVNRSEYLCHSTHIVVNHIPTTNVILTTCVVGIPLFMIQKTEYQKQSYRPNLPFLQLMIVVGRICFCYYKQWNTNNTSNQYYNCCWYMFYYSDLYSDWLSTDLLLGPVCEVFREHSL